MKKFAIQVFLLSAIAIFALALATSKVPGLSFLPQKAAATTPLTIGTTNVNVEIANTPELRKQGLSGRSSLATDSGMLFVYASPSAYTFWMKGMKFPLDLIWIKSGKVVDIITNAPVPDPKASDDSLPRFLSNQPVDTVLEVNSGFVQKNGIVTGDSVQLVK